MLRPTVERKFISRVGPIDLNVVSKLFLNVHVLDGCKEYDLFTSLLVSMSSVYL